MNDPDPSLIVVAIRVIKPGGEKPFEADMKEFLAIAGTFPGCLGMQMLRPAESAEGGEYTVLARFESLEARRTFTGSEIYRSWMQRLDEHSVRAPVVRELSGIEGWFSLAGQPGGPPKWKMALTVWAGVYLISMTTYALLGPLFDHWPRALQSLLVAGIVVGLLTWVVLPRTARWLHRWYFPRPRASRRPHDR